MHCRECIRGLQVTNNNIKYAERLRAEILNRIATQQFEYSDYFPNSRTRTARQLGSYKCKLTVAELLDSIEWDDIAPKQTTAYTYKRDAKYARSALGHIRVSDLTAVNI